MIIIKCSFLWWTIRAIKITFCFTLLFWILFAGNFVLRCYGPESDFISVNYLDWGFIFATKIAVNIFFNNKQTVKRYCP